MTMFDWPGLDIHQSSIQLNTYGILHGKSIKIRWTVQKIKVTPFKSDSTTLKNKHVYKTFFLVESMQQRLVIKEDMLHFDIRSQFIIV